MLDNNPYQTPSDSLPIAGRQRLEFTVLVRLLAVLSLVLFFTACFMPAILYSQAGPGTIVRANGFRCLWETACAPVYLFFAPTLFPVRLLLFLANVNVLVSSLRLALNPRRPLANGWLILAISSLVFSQLTHVFAVKLLIGFYLWFGSLLLVLAALVLQKFAAKNNGP